MGDGVVSRAYDPLGRGGVVPQDPRVPCLTRTEVSLLAPQLPQSTGEGKQMGRSRRTWPQVRGRKPSWVRCPWVGSVLADFPPASRGPGNFYAPTGPKGPPDIPHCQGARESSAHLGREAD